MRYAFQKLGVQLDGDVFLGLTVFFLLCLLVCRLANEGFLFLILFLAKAKSIILFAPVISALGGALGCAIHHILASLAASAPVEFMLVGGMVQGATPMQWRGCVV
mgnify:CR=1 FL=1